VALRCWQPAPAPGDWCMPPAGLTVLPSRAGESRPLRNKKHAHASLPPSYRPPQHPRSFTNNPGSDVGVVATQPPPRVRRWAGPTTPGRGDRAPSAASTQICAENPGRFEVASQHQGRTGPPADLNRCERGRIELGQPRLARTGSRRSGSFSAGGWRILAPPLPVRPAASLLPRRLCARSCGRVSYSGAQAVLRATLAGDEM
jgi:hypothetical protein